MRPVVDVKVLQQKKTVALARWLLGKHLVRRSADGREDARMIVEVEAYNGEEDQACHARAGRTKRTEVMYGAGGVWYVYLCYGIHEMLNLVVGPRDFPAAILIRGVEGASGPGRVTKALGIDRKLNGAPATREESGLWLEDRGVRVPGRIVEATPRIGIDYAGPIWTMKHWRFTFDPRALSSPPPGPPPTKSTRGRVLAARRARAAPVAPTSRDP
jgi:DNA-3-methyladenine glycosylase